METPLIFISYSSEDKEFVDRLRKDLQAHGLSIWIDDQEIQPGESISSEISEGLQMANFLLAILTQESVASPWCKKEIAFALHKGAKGEGTTTIIPVILEDCEAPPLLRDISFVDFRRWADSPEVYEKGFKELLTAFEMRPGNANRTEKLSSHGTKKSSGIGWVAGLMITAAVCTIIGTMYPILKDSFVAAKTNNLHSVHNSQNSQSEEGKLATCKESLQNLLTLAPEHHDKLKAFNLDELGSKKASYRIKAVKFDIFPFKCDPEIMNEIMVPHYISALILHEFSKPQNELRLNRKFIGENNRLAIKGELSSKISSDCDEINVSLRIIGFLNGRAKPTRQVLAQLSPRAGIRKPIEKLANFILEYLEEYRD